MVKSFENKKGGCLKSRLLFRQPVEFKIKSLYCNDLILNVAHKIKEAVQKLKFLDSPFFLPAGTEPVSYQRFRDKIVSSIESVV